MLLGAGKCTCQNVSLDNHCLTALGCYWLDQFLTLALDAWILSKFSTLYWICLLLVFLILVGVELPLCL